MFAYAHGRHRVPKVTAGYTLMIVKTRLGMRETLTWECKHSHYETGTQFAEKRTLTHNHLFDKQVEGVHALYFFIRDVQSLYLIQAAVAWNLHVVVP